MIATTSVGPVPRAVTGPPDVFKPLVVGAPRSGFALLASVLIHFVPFATGRWTVRQQVFNALVDGADGLIAEAIVREFAANGVAEDLIYNPNFRRLTGGPKWLRQENTSLACFRKYIGVRGLGDFTLITSHPREVLDHDEVVHSHTDPGLWLRHAGYTDYVKFASLRNPVGILNSSVFSINALASEYIQKFIPRDRDNDALRQQLALYKLTDLDFVRGLVKFLVGYLDEFLKHWRDFHVMRWEDLILTPVPTIMRLAGQAGIPLRKEQADRIWSRLDHVNLTGHHRHNYREGKGIVGNWREWLVNEHLELFESMGLEPLMVELGYGRMPRLREEDYTPFQQKVHAFIARGEICRETEDLDLFTFAFNKSNIASDSFPFKRHPWRTWTRIERSIFKDEPLEARIWDVAEDMTGRVNAAFGDFLSHDHHDVEDLAAALRALESRHADLFNLAPKRMEAAFANAREALQRARDGGRRSATAVAVAYQAQPMLVESIGGHNIVAFRDAYYVVPQTLGEFRLDECETLDTQVVRQPTLPAAIAEVLARTGEPAADRTAAVSTPGSTTPRLSFVDAMPEAFAAACRQHLDEGHRRILLKPFNELARTIHSLIAGDVERAGGRLLVADGDAPAGLSRAPIEDADLVIVCEREEPQVSDQLLELVDVNAAVVAAKTARLWLNQPLFVVSIPKAGTHLLYSLAEAMGYTAAVVLHDDAAPGCWYCVEFSNSHTVARDFFVDSVRRSPFGNRHHPFMRSPALFIYRNPLDIVASEASYYHREGKTAFAGYLSGLPPEERLLRLIDDPWLLGSIRDRVGGFIPWLSFPNVMPVSFEELVGAQGGGSADLQRRTVWAIQLKLHVPGEARKLSEMLFDRDSPTFDTARIGRYRDVFTDEAYRRFGSLPQDFMVAYGYEGADRETLIPVPRRAEEFRRRPLRLLEREPDVPITVQFGYLGFNIVRFRDRYFAIRQSEGDIDLMSADFDALEAQHRIFPAASAEEARRTAEYQTITAITGLAVRSSTSEGDRAAASAEEPQLIRSGYHGFNIVQYGSHWYGVPQHLGTIDLRTADIQGYCGAGDLLVADSQADVERFVDQRLDMARRETQSAADRSLIEDLQRQLRESMDREEAARAQQRRHVAVEQSRAAVLEQTIESLAARLREKESALAALSAEVEEMRTWVQELQQRVVRTSGGNRRKR